MNKLRKPPSGFTMVPNALIRSAALSLKAKGLYCLLFAKPDNWIYVEEALINESLDGRESYRAGIKELVEAGWLSKVQVRDDKGVFSHIDWHLSVDGKPVGGEPDAGQTVAGQSPSNNTDDIKTEEVRPSVSPKPMKATPRANPRRSIASALEDLETIPAELGDRAVAVYGLSIDAVSDEWAKFRNHHISARSKHTRIDLCWDTWCRNAAKWARGSKAAASGKAGPGGYQRHDHVAAAVNSAMVDLYGVRYTGHGGQGAQPADEACPFPDGAEEIDAVFVDARPGNAAREASAGSIDGSRADSVGGSSLPLEIVSG